MSTDTPATEKNDRTKKLLIGGVGLAAVAVIGISLASCGSSGHTKAHGVTIPSTSITAPNASPGSTDANGAPISGIPTIGAKTTAGASKTSKSPAGAKTTAGKSASKTGTTPAKNGTNPAPTHSTAPKRYNPEPPTHSTAPVHSNPAPPRHTTPAPPRHTTPAPPRHTTPAPPRHTTPAPPRHTNPPFSPHFLSLGEPSGMGGLPAGSTPMGQAHTCAQSEGDNCNVDNIRYGGTAACNFPNYGKSLAGANYAGWAMWEYAPGNCSFAEIVSTFS